MIARITLEKFEETYTMLFGDSYKKWYLQLREYMGRNFCSPDRGWNREEMLGHIRKVEVSKSAWKGWGGLKWCNEASFQEELNREGVQDGEPDNKNPRQYSSMSFEEKPVSFAEKYL